MTFRGWRLAVASMCGLAAGVVPVAAVMPGAIAVGPSAPGLIVYSDDLSLHTMHSDGGEKERIKLSGNNWDEPAWSIDGTKIAASHYGIVTMRSDGTHRKRVTTGFYDANPSWSPDGRRLVFDSQRRHNGLVAIFRVNADGRGLTRLTKWTAEDVNPSWSPDGSKIVFDSVSGHGLTTMNPDGSGKTPISGSPPNAFNPSWSTDGTHIAFSGGNGCIDIYTINANGTGLSQLTSYCDDHRDSTIYAADFHPSWSLDGTQLVFERERNGDGAVFRINADGGGLAQLTKWSDEDRTPSWGPVVPWCGGHSATVIGTAGDDTLIGGAGPDVIVGRDGDDTIKAGGGDDTVCGNAGADTIYGNHGNDVLSGGPGNDAIYGGWGTDKLRGGHGTDNLHQ
jgi:Tol biopolymer transport system component